MTAERRVFKSVCLCASVYQTTAAFSNPLMDRLTPKLTRDSTHMNRVLVFKGFKAKKSTDSDTALKYLTYVLLLAFTHVNKSEFNCTYLSSNL